MSQSNDNSDIPLEPSTDSCVLDYGFRIRARLPRDPTDGRSIRRFVTPGAFGSADGSLKSLLRDSMIHAVEDDKQTLLPLGRLDVLCNPRAVQNELLHTFQQNTIDITQYVNYVCGSPDDRNKEENVSRKIFAILVLIDQVHTITTFFEKGIKDRDLPFRKLATRVDPDPCTLMIRETLDNSNPRIVTFLNNWRSQERRDFYQIQWQVLSPFFGKPPGDSAALYKLDEQTIMPWVHIGQEQNGRYTALENIGGYAKVTKVEIHQDHHSFECNIFAIKQLFDGDKGPFKNEFDSLKKVQTRKHLLPVHAAYVRGKQYSFIFPWAHGGSLEDLWKKEPHSLLLEPKKDFHVLVKWVAAQLSGLTGESGLGFLHKNEQFESSGDQPISDEKPFGIHGDLKPSNILYFKQDASCDNLDAAEDLLKISDFGLTGFHSAMTRSGQPATGPHSPTYRSPEWGRGGIHVGFLSRKYDIWSLGCVFLQFLVWLIDGPKALTQFNEDRTNDKCDTGTKFREDKFFVIDGKDPYIKASVTQWANKLQNKVSSGNYLYDCLTFITTRMLEVEVDKRADCGEVHEFLKKHHAQCNQDDEYSKIDISKVYWSKSQGPSRLRSESGSRKTPQASYLNKEIGWSDPIEQLCPNPQITVTDTQNDDSNHDAILSLGNRDCQENPRSQEENPLPSPPGLLLPSQESASQGALAHQNVAQTPASHSPIEVSNLSGNSPRREPSPVGKFWKCTSSPRRQISKWLCRS
ncbi:kinase-like domain-containing protein [Xylaria digitata]|nr:kinase-like domain-containing protein [Xylaria digitata]